MIKTHTFCGRKYIIDLEPYDGLCTCYKLERELHVLRDLGTKAGLESVIHECLHACMWPASETRTEQTAADIARFLWRLGYRKE